MADFIPPSPCGCQEHNYKFSVNAGMKTSLHLAVPLSIAPRIRNNCRYRQSHLGIAPTHPALLSSNRVVFARGNRALAGGTKPGGMEAVAEFVGASTNWRG